MKFCENTNEKSEKPPTVLKKPAPNISQCPKSRPRLENKENLANDSTHFSEMLKLLQSDVPSYQYWKTLAEERSKIIKQQDIKISWLCGELERLKDVEEHALYFAELYEMIRDGKELPE